MTNDKNNAREDQSSRDQLIDTLGHLLFIFGVMAFLISDVIVSFLPFGDKGIFWATVAIRCIAPLGFLLLVYSRRRQIKAVTYEVKRDGFTNAMQNIARRQEAAIAAKGPVITDPIAQSIPWSPVKPAIAQLRMKLDIQAGGILSMRYSQFSIYRAFVISAALLLLTTFPYWITLLPVNPLPAPIALLAPHLEPYLLIAGLVLVAIVMMPFYDTYAETIIDKQKGILEQTKPWFSLRRPTLHQILLSNVYAIQLLAYKRNSSSDNYSPTKYEMNLVLKNAERINVMSGYNRDALKRAGAEVALNLVVPLWDKTHIIHDQSIAWIQDLDR